MISSMTGFARETVATDFGTLSIELRSINHRYLETYFKLPDLLRAFEPALRDQAQSVLKRGKLEIMMRLEAAGATNEHLTLNETLAKNVIALHQEANAILGTTHALSPSELMRFPNMLITRTPDPDALEAITTQTFATALQSLAKNRQAEGARIQAVIEDRLNKIAALTEQAQALRPEAIVRLRDKLTARLAEFAIEVDQQRLEQELVFAIQKLDIDEEIDRLHSHVVAMTDAIARNEPIGRRLDFLTQELNREANTLGSKSQDAELTTIAVELKVLIEQIREQIQNIE
ncbi:YicC family protein [Wohlfahrtiimonas chitiniclastica]|uniref:YicC/YloC family endoribonuclease n=1 Tax=Wohlfahrtiimonas chitiniclastica TaxID=400946 RepID=UPI001BCAE997|nr:YicC/YloC family endoribonuclease [Wohlfahrtiimonas chitiniclastica]MBS7833545.1 YicC family protein [Wohlfahrtiimonas chitiniclastica]